MFWEKYIYLINYIRLIEKMEKERIYVTQSSMPSYERYIEAIKPLWESHWLTNMGKYHQKLEQSLKEYLDVPNISLMVNGHMALELTIQAMGFPEGSEVITTPFTFISTTHAIIRNRLKPIFCDIKAEDGTIDENKIEDMITEQTVAIIPVHVYGNICNVEKIQQIADKYNLKVIYDAAHAFGVRYKEKGIGNYGDASVFSFHATKVFNTVEGGAVAFSEQEFYDKLYDLKNFGIRGEELITEVGVNAKMNEFCAIMGLCNLENIDFSIKKRKKQYEYYNQAIKKIKGLRCLEKNIHATQSYTYFPVFVENDYFMTRNELYEYLKMNGIYTRKYFYPLTSDQVCFGDEFRNVDLKCARKLSESVLVLPLYEELKLEVIEKIIRFLKR